MTEPWLFAGAPQAVPGEQTTLIEGTTFCIGDSRGDLGREPSSGLFVRDTRVLRRWELTVAGRAPNPLRVHQQSPHDATFVLHCPADPSVPTPELVVTRRRFVGDGIREDITVRNLGPGSAHVEVSLRVESDFADLFEVKEGRAESGQQTTARLEDGVLTLSRVRAGLEFGVGVQAQPVARTEADELRWTVDLPPHRAWTAVVQGTPRIRGQQLEPHHLPETVPDQAVPERRQQQFRSGAPRLETGSRVLADVLSQSIEDLAMLRIFEPQKPELPVIAAGAPWFMALFGRDSLLTSLMLLPIDASLALGTLTTLANHQGDRVDPVTEEEPGRILHEIRFGPAGTLALGGAGAYFGSVDATPLFVMALGALLQWHPSLVTEELVGHADRALEWMGSYGDSDGDGFIEYARSTDSGLVNQGWKDSWDGVNFADGRLPRAPIALAEVQAYAYGAHLARAELADAAGDGPTAARCRTTAAELKRSFNERFWLPERGWYAVGLDRDKRPIDALTSNVGHCLWTGIADEDKAAQVARHLTSPQMFTGWGIRTLSSEMSAYGPMSYHNGSVWPHDTVLCISGLARYGFRDEAVRIGQGLLDAAATFGHRLPELFGGFDRDDVPVPVPYPAACSPQAWSSAAPVELLRVLLGLRPDGDGLVCEAVVPHPLLPLNLYDVLCRGRRWDVVVDAAGAAVRPAVQRAPDVTGTAGRPAPAARGRSRR